MAPVVYQQITATCNAHNPIPPEGASESDRSRLFELCGLKRTYQKDKDSLQTRARLAKLKGAYYTKDEQGNKCQILKNSEFLVAQCLLSEGRASAVPVGWLQVAPIRMNYLEISSAMPAQAVVPQPVVYDMPSVPPADADAVQAAKEYFEQPLSYRDMREPGLFEKHKQVLQDSAIQGDRFSTGADALTVIMDMKQNKRSLSKEDKLQFKLLLKPCMDISIWKGYDPDDHSKNAAYYGLWYKRMVPSSATVEDDLNKYQEYCRLVHHKEAVPVTSCEDLKAFYDWFVVRVERNEHGETQIGRSWRHIASMVYFHGYITPEEWRAGGFPDPNSHFTFKQDTMRTAKANGKRLAQTSEEGYDCGDRGWLSKEEIRQISDLLWDKRADDVILLHQFASMATQTFIRPEELLQLRRRNTWLSESSDYNAKSGSIKLMEILSKGENKKSKTSRLLSWVVRNRELDHMCPWFWSAARLMHDYQRMLPAKEDGCYGTMADVFKDRPKVVMRRRSPINPLTEMIESKESVCCMIPLMPGRRFVARVGSGPMKSAFHFSNHLEFNKHILHPVFVKLKLDQRLKGCATRVLRASAMCRLWHMEVAKSSTKEASKHDNQDAVDTFYNLKCPGNSLKTILIAAGYQMQDNDSWKDVFVQGRGLYTLERIQQERPDVWQLISDELVPGLEAWVTEVKARDSHGLEAFERVNGYQALLQWELLATFLQDSTHHFFQHRNSPVFLELPIFHNPVFTDWLLGDFRQHILRLQLEADICYKHIRDKRKETTLLDAVFSERGQPASVADQESMLHEVYSRIIQAADSSGQASRQQVQEVACRAAAEELAASAVHHAGDPGVITMPMGGNLDLTKLWRAWEPDPKTGKAESGCDALRIYKAESPDLYPSDQRWRHQMRWLRQMDGNRFDQFKQVLLTMDRLVRKKNSGNRKRDASTLIKNWEISLFSAPQCPINTMAGLAVALKDYASGRPLLSGASGGQKRKADGALAKQITREKLEFFFQLV